MGEPKTFRQRWNEYGERPPVARWTSRFAYAVIGPAVTVAVAGGVGWCAWRLLVWLF